MTSRPRQTTLAALGLTPVGGRAALARTPISGIAVDSREVGEGTLFAALPGSRVHGR